MIVTTHALSLTLPWASLVEVVAKKRETRSWPTRFRGWVAIHASKSFPRDCRDLIAGDSLIERALLAAGYVGWRDLMPSRGRVLCVARVVDCIATDEWTPDPGSWEWAFGDYSPGRYSFGLADVRKLREPLACRGMLGFWRLPQPITEDMLQ